MKPGAEAKAAREAQADQGPELEPVQIRYPASMATVGKAEGHRALCILIPGVPPVMHIYPMTVEAAEGLGKQLSAPSVVMPS